MSNNTIPPGKTWFDTHKQTFSDVTIGPDGGIDTASFLDAAEATTTLFGFTYNPSLLRDETNVRQTSSALWRSLLSRMT
jgi:hypothetical protein